MQVAVADGPLAGEVTVTVRRRGATVADLARCLGLPGDGLVVGGIRRDARTALEEAGLHEGAVVGSPDDEWAEPAHPGPGTPTVQVVAGLDAGATWALDAAGAVAGRDPAVTVHVSSETVSWHHARLTADADGTVVEDSPPRPSPCHRHPRRPPAGRRSARP